jgi:hypothetical protein
MLLAVSLCTYLLRCSENDDKRNQQKEIDRGATEDQAAAAIKFPQYTHGHALRSFANLGYRLQTFAPARAQ